MQQHPLKWNMYSLKVDNYSISHAANFLHHLFVLTCVLDHGADVIFYQ